MRRLSHTVRALAGLAATLVPACVTSGTETDNPVGPRGFEIRRSALAYQEDVTVPADDAEALRAGNLEFALSLYREVAAGADTEENLFLGTHSVTTVLAMTAAGARGDTEAELAAALGSGLAPDALHPAMNQLAQRLQAELTGSAVRYQPLNGLWLAQERPTSAPFLDVLSEQYDTGVFLVDFAGDAEGARGLINDWVSTTTDGLIPTLFAPGQLTPLTALVLSNAAYLSAPWQDRFDPETTTDLDFTLPDGDVVTVPMMGRTWPFPFAITVDWRAVELPFRDADLGMVFVLPNTGEFAEFEAGFDRARVEEIVEQLEAWRDAPEQVRALIPRFEFASEIDLQPALDGLGVSTLFDPSAADLTGIDPAGGLFVDALVHRTTVGVDEEGTTAAVATGEVMVPLSIDPQVRLDRPFLFFVYDHGTGTVLFVGRLVHPAGEARPPETTPTTPTDTEVICAGLALCADRATTEDECSAALADDDPAVLEQCADCIQAGIDGCGGYGSCDRGIGDICQPATCADFCPARSF
jgi:serpin B